MTTSSFFGYNVFSYDTQFIEHMERLQPRALLFLQNDGGAKDAYRRLNPDPANEVSIIIAREVNDQYEKSMFRTPGESLKYIQKRRADIKDDRIFINWLCEPGRDGWQAINDEGLKIVDWCVREGVRFAGPHLAHYGASTDEFKKLIPLASAMALRPDLFVWGFDEYFAAVPFSGVYDPRFQGPISPNETGHINPATWLDPGTPGYFHHTGAIGRLFDEMRLRGLSLPIAVNMEGGSDNLGDVEGWRESLIHDPQWPYIKGWRTLIPQWQQWIAELGLNITAREYYVRGLEAIRDNLYKRWPNIVAYCLFAYGGNGDPLWTSHDHRDAEVMALLERTTKGTVVSNPTPTAPDVHSTAALVDMIMTKANGAFANIRNAPTSVDTKVVGTVSPQTRVKGAASDVRNSYLYIVKDDGIRGWVSLQGGKVAFEPVNAQPVPPLRFGRPLDKPYLYGNLFDHPRPTYATLFPGKLAKHEGLDVKRKPGVTGEVSVLALQTGKIVANGFDDDGYGWFVAQEVDWYGTKYRIHYGHLFAKSDLKVGDVVTIGEPIAYMGNTGQSSAEHLHITVSIPSQPNNYVVSGAIDPLPFMPPVESEPDTDPDTQPAPELPLELREALAAVFNARANLTLAQQQLNEALAKFGNVYGPL
jgi:murein DD-endopeptidase MepM/ murein hydrolase activator NlpD